MDTAPKNIADNRKARFDYEIGKIYEAGVELKGYEVKSAKGGRFQIVGAHVLIRGAEAWLVNSHIPAYQTANTPDDYEEDRARKLLLAKSEIKELQGILQDKSKHLIALRAYIKHGMIKLEIGIGRSRKKSDKREVIKKRSHNREMRDGE